MGTSGAGHCIDMDQFAGPLAFIAHYRLRFEGGQPSKADAQHCSEPAGDSWAHSFDRRDGPGRRGAGLSSRIRASVMMHSLSARPEVRQTLGAVRAGTRAASATSVTRQCSWRIRLTSLRAAPGRGCC